MSSQSDNSVIIPVTNASVIELASTDHSEIARRLHELKLIPTARVVDLDFRIFNVYDQARTRGVDLPNPRLGRALVTTTSDTTLNTLNQAVKRMRGLTSDFKVFFSSISTHHD